MQNEHIIDFTLVYNKYKNKVYNYTVKVVRSHMLAEDIVHDVFVKLYDNMHGMRNPEKIEFWIFSTTRNAIYSHFRNKMNTRSDDIALCDNRAAEGSIAEDLANKELSDLVHEELQRMDPVQSEVFYLKQYGELSYKDIGTVMGIPEDLVRSRLFKVRQKLKNFLLNLE